MTDGAPTDRAFSAGGVIYRERAGTLEVVLVGRAQHGLWALPKGTPNAGERPADTARREVEEETGLRVEVVGDLGSIFYTYPQRDRGGRRVDGVVAKEVAHYLLRATGGDTSLHDHEYDLVEWVAYDEALARLTYDNEREVLARVPAAVAALGAAR